MIPKSCHRCGGRRIVLGLIIMSNGRPAIQARCAQCKSIADSKNPAIKKSEVPDWENLPVFENYALSSEPCAVCKKRGTEYHHWAPRHLFGYDADRWPGAYLCPEHHKQWHDTVTPNMAKRRKP